MIMDWMQTCYTEEAISRSESYADLRLPKLEISFV